jgi:hypothetical protein
MPEYVVSTTLKDGGDGVRVTAAKRELVASTHRVDGARTQHLVVATFDRSMTSASLGGRMSTTTEGGSMRTVLCLHYVAAEKRKAL